MTIAKQNARVKISKKITRTIYRKPSRKITWYSNLNERKNLRCTTNTTKLVINLLVCGWSRETKKWTQVILVWNLHNGFLFTKVWRENIKNKIPLLIVVVAASNAVRSMRMGRMIEGWLHRLVVSRRWNLLESGGRYIAYERQSALRRSYHLGDTKDRPTSDGNISGGIRR